MMRITGARAVSTTSQVRRALGPMGAGSFMGDHERENEKSLKDRAKELIQGVVGALESLFPEPAPRLVPVPVRPRRPVRR